MIIGHGKLTERPLPGYAGRYYFSTDIVKLCRDNGAVWIELSGGSAGMHAISHENGGADEVSLTGLSGDPADTINESLLTTQGDIVKRGVAIAERLALGTLGQALVAGAAEPAYANISLGGIVVAPTNATQLWKDAAYLTSGSVCNGTNDEVDLAAANTIGGTVVMAPGSFEIDDDLTINNADFKGQGRNTILNLNNDKGIIITEGGRLHSVLLNAPAGYVGTALEINGDAGEWQDTLLVYDNIHLYCPTITAGSIGLLLTVTAPGAGWGSLALLTFGSIHIQNFENGFMTDANFGTGGAYINGNIFGPTVIWGSEYLLNLTSSKVGAQIQGNIFTSLQLQPTAAQTVDGIKIVTGGDDLCFNQFPNVYAWDWGLAAGYAVNIGSLCAYTYIQGCLADSISDSGYHNIIIDQYYTAKGQIELFVAGIADHQVHGEYLRGMIAGENLAFPDLVYFKSDGEFWKTDADAAATTAGKLALATETITANNTGRFLTRGAARDDSWSWTVGATLYVSTTTGGITETKPSGSGDQVRIIGYAKSAVHIFFEPDDTIVEVP